jgi:cell filamentation protein
VSRYDVGAPGEDEFQPGSDRKVLRNWFGFTSLHDVNYMEAALFAVAQGRSYGQIETNTPFTVSLIRELHRSWLGPLYTFAGEIRTIDLAKGTVHFAPVAYMATSLKELDRVLAEHTPCEGMGLDRIITAIASVHTELVLVHPFREGNGRLSRWVADLMALQAGFPPLEWGFDWEPEARRERYFTALRRGFAMEFSPLEALVREALESALRLAEDPHAEP